MMSRSDGVKPTLEKGYFVATFWPGSVAFLHSFSTFLPALTASYQVALRLFRNKTAADADRLGQWFDPTRPQRGPKCMLTTYGIEEVTRAMIAYAALHVRMITGQLYDVTQTDCCRPISHYRPWSNGALRTMTSTLLNSTTSSC